MRKKIKVLFEFAFIFAVFLNSSQAAQLTYCVPVSNFDLNPYREIKDGKELAYFMLLTRSYISTVDGVPGLLEAYEFSPDGKVFTARVSSSALWPDKKQLTPEEAAEGIVKGFKYRSIGKRLKIVKTEVMNTNTFRLYMDSEIANIVGTLKEVISSGSRHNRLWPIKKGKYGFQVISPYEYSYQQKNIVLKVDGHEITIVGKSKCGNVDFTIYPELLKTKLSDFDSRPIPMPQAITAQFNTNRISLSHRKSLGCWLRNAFKQASAFSGIVTTNSFFLEGEAGYSADFNSQACQSAESDSFRKLKLVVATEIPVFRKAIEKHLVAHPLSIKFIDFPLMDSNFDVQILSSSIVKGRHIILQDLLNWNFSKELLGSAKKTISLLELITKESASTVPPNESLLFQFSTAADQEQSLVPLGRRFAATFSRSSLPVFLAWNAASELIFQSKKR